MEQRRASRCRRRRQDDTTKKVTRRSALGRDTAFSAPSSRDDTNRTPPPALDNVGGSETHNDDVNANGEDGDDLDDIDPDDEDEDDDDDDEDDDEDDSGTASQVVGRYGNPNGNGSNDDDNYLRGQALSGDLECRPFRGAVGAIGAIGAVGSVGVGGAGGAVGPRTGGGESGGDGSGKGDNTGLSPPSSRRRNSGMATSAPPPARGAETSPPGNEVSWTGDSGGKRASHARWRSWAGEGGSSGRKVGLGVPGSGEGGVGDEAEEDEIVRRVVSIEVFVCLFIWLVGWLVKCCY